MTERTRVGIIGAGAIVQVAHLPVLRRMKNVDLVAICDSDLPKARVVADRFKITDAFDDIEEVLQYEELDVLLICTPNHLHESHILAALSRGLHVLVEKPLATSVESVKRIKNAVDKHDRVLMVGMNHRYRPDVEIVRGFVQSGELGAIESIRGSWHVFKPSRSQLGWRLKRELSGGGAMLDLGLAILDLGLWLAGNPAPKRVTASFGKSADLSGRHLESDRRGRAIRGGVARRQGLRQHQSSHGVEEDARGSDGRVALRGRQPRERFLGVLPC
jgi:predicted dehydrogenase